MGLKGVCREECGGEFVERSVEQFVEECMSNDEPLQTRTRVGSRGSLERMSSVDLQFNLWHREVVKLRWGAGKTTLLNHHPPNYNHSNHLPLPSRGSKLFPGEDQRDQATQDKELRALLERSGLFE